MSKIKNEYHEQIVEASREQIVDDSGAVEYRDEMYRAIAKEIQERAEEVNFYEGDRMRKSEYFGDVWVQVSSTLTIGIEFEVEVQATYDPMDEMLYTELIDCNLISIDGKPATAEDNEEVKSHIW